MSSLGRWVLRYNWVEMWRKNLYRAVWFLLLTSAALLILGGVWQLLPVQDLTHLLFTLWVFSYFFLKLNNNKLELKTTLHQYGDDWWRSSEWKTSILFATALLRILLGSWFKIVEDEVTLRAHEKQHFTLKHFQNTWMFVFPLMLTQLHPVTCPP